MNPTISAIFENGIFRPLQPVDLDNGEEVEVILVKRTESNASDARAVINRIAELPLEGASDQFSGSDHDAVLYPTVEDDIR